MKNIFFVLICFPFLIFSQNNVTFQLDMNNVDPAIFTTPEVNGTFNGWCGSCAAMTDTDGDNVWEVTIDLANGPYEFKYSADGWGIQENLLSGSWCTVTNFGFTNRTLTVSGDTTLAVVCWESCSSCGSGPSAYDVTFEVDMRGVNQSYTTPEVNGAFNGWCGNCWPMDDSDGDSIWQLQMTFAPGDSLVWKYSADNWNIQEDLDSSLSCVTINYNPGAPNGWGNINRVAVVNSDTTFSAPWNFCNSNLSYVPDDNFENFLETNGMGDGIPFNNYVLTQNISNVDTLIIDSLNITDLTGIEDFLNLSFFSCNYNLLTSINLNTNTNLTNIFCDYNQLTNLDISNNNMLYKLYCRNNQLLNLDVSSNIYLSELFCSNNLLTSLDVDMNPVLNFLICDNNYLTTLDVSSNSQLYTLDISSNQFNTIDVSSNYQLIQLRFGNNQIMNLDISSNTQLITLYAPSNQITNLDLSNQTQLRYLHINSNQIDSLDLISNFQLMELYCFGNQLSSLDLSFNYQLKYLQCSSNQLTSLDVSSNPSLEYLSCSSNQLISLDVSSNPLLDVLSCSSNQLTSLDLRNGNNINMNYIYINPSITNNPQLYCIDVDNSSWANSNWTVANGNIDPTVSFSNDCSIEIFGCTDSTALNFSPLSTIDDGSCIVNLLVSVDSIVISNPISCSGSFANIDVYVDNDTNTVLGGTPSFVTYQLKAFKLGAFATFSYFSSSQTSGSVVTANGLDQSTYYMLVVDSVAFNTTYNPFAQFFGNSYFINNVLNDPSVYDFDTITISNPVFGCMDSLDVNYNPFAVCDDGSCICDLTTSFTNVFPSDSISCDGISIISSSSSYPIVSYSWEDQFGNIVSTNDYGLNLCNDIYFVTTVDSSGCILIDTLLFGSIYGCTDSSAINYFWGATVDDGSCIPAIYGCLDSLAFNYDSTANIDDGSCCFSNTYTSSTEVDFFTNYGQFRVSLYDSLMPITTSNFINLVSTGFYDGSLFHRVIANFMIQGGDVNPPPPIIPDEFDSTLSNIQMTISMANSGPNTGSCQFFINLVNNTYLDFDEAPFTSAHPVFGITISGFNIVQDIGNVQTNFNDVPYVDVVMDSVRIVSLYQPYTSCAGCTDPLALNYDSTLAYDDGSCIYPSGCTDPLAYNYDSVAITDDSSCLYCDLTNTMIVSQNTIGSCNGFIIANSSSSNTPISFLWSNGSTGTNIIGLCSGVYSILITDNVGCTLEDTIYMGVIAGCTDSLASNFDSTATIDDGSCIYNILGCTDSTALNYDSLATVDDGSCLIDDCIFIFELWNYLPPPGAQNIGWSNPDGSYNYLHIYFNGVLFDSLTSTTGSNYSSENHLLSIREGDTLDVYFINNGSAANECMYRIYDPNNNLITTQGFPGSIPGDFINFINNCNSILGCTDSLASNFDSTATTDDGSCLYCVYGCMDVLACNYDSLATCDDGSCLIDDCIFIFELWNYLPPPGAQNIGWSNPDGSYNYLHIYFNGVLFDSLTSTTGSNYSSENHLLSIREGDTLDVYFINNGSAANECMYRIYDPNNNLITTQGFPGSIPGDFINFINNCNSILGCTDSLASNFDSTATTDDGSCLYCVYGCMDVLACNYDSLATCDDGSCLTLYGCTDTLANNYDTIATCDDGSCTYSSNCSSPKPTGLFAFDVIDTRAKVSWDNMNDPNCMVWKYFVRYREVGTSQWTTKSAGVGNGLCNFGLNTVTKQLLNLTPSTTYEFKMKAFYCGGTSSNYSQPVQFTTSDVCPDMTNLTTTTFNGNQAKVRFDWDTTGAYTFARILLRVDTAGSAWQTAGGFGIYYPTFFVNKFGLQSGQSYRAQGRTFCDSNITAYRSPTWTPPIFWTQPGTIRNNGGSSINNLDIYPNPSRDVFNISFTSDEIQDLGIRIINTIGAEVYREERKEFIGEYTKQISLDNYGKGIYFLEIETNSGIVNKKLILQ